MEGKLLYQHLGDERLLCLQVYRPRFLGGKTIPNHYGPLISQKCGSTEIKLRRNLAKLYTARSFDNHDPLTSWANGPFAIRKDRVLRAAEITTGDELQQSYRVEHNFFYSTNLGGLSPTVLDELAKENDLTFVNGVDIESLLGVANSYNPFSLRIFGNDVLIFSFGKAMCSFRPDSYSVIATKNRLFTFFWRLNLSKSS